MDGRQIYSEKGKLVATLNDDGEPVMAPGMAGAHSAGVRDFINTFAQNEPVANDDETTDCGTADQSDDEYLISTIPEEKLPPFSKKLGVNTPGFGEYVKSYKLTGPQVAALVKRLS